MKKLLSTLLSLLFILSVFAGCENKQPPVASPENSTLVAAEKTTDYAPPTSRDTENNSINGFITAIAPSNETVSLHTEKQTAFLRNKNSNIRIYADGKKELSKPQSVCFKWNSSDNIGSFTVSISENSDMKNSICYYTNENSIYIDNFKVGTKYYWTVSANGITSQTASFTTEELCPRNINVDGVTNVRDLGGRVTDKGTKTNQGLIYRCGRLNESSAETVNIEITEDGIKTMRNLLGIKTEIDLRKVSDGETGEITASPLGSDVNYVNCPMGWQGDIFVDNKDEIIHLFNVLSDRNNYPIIFHCNIGTDRTGMVAYLLNALAGVSEEDIMTDYLFSNFGNIGGSRKESNVLKSGYYKAVSEADGNTLSEKTYNALQNLGVPKSQLDNVIDILVSQA